MSITDEQKNTIQPPTNRITAILIGLLAAIAYVPLAYIAARLTGPSFSGGSYSLLFTYSLGAIGIPVAAWFRYGLRGPITAMAAIFGFWHIIVPILGNEGDAPAFAIALLLAPAYIVAYTIVGGIEYMLRRRAGRNLLPTR